MLNKIKKEKKITLLELNFAYFRVVIVASIILTSKV